MSSLGGAMPQVTSYRHGVPCWIDTSAADVDATAAFYGALFGWALGPDLGPEAGGYRMLTKDGLDVAGIGPVMDPDAPPSWTTYVKVDDVDAALAAVTANGGTVVAGPMDLPNGSGRLGFALDPTGGFFGLMQQGTHAGAQLVNETGTLVWNELTVRDASRALDFYAQVVGWTHEPMDPSSPEGYRLVKVQGRTVAGCMPMGDDFPPELPTHWMVYFGADDTDATAARCAELGGQVSVPPTDLPIGRFAVLNDPNGVVFSVIAFNGPADDPNDWPD